MTNSASSAGTPSWLGLIGWVVLAAAAGAVGAIASVHAADFYGQLNRPAWAPPSWLFGPVWTALYLLMGVAAWLVWRERGGEADAAAARRTGLTLFVAQLVLNALWSWLFFGWHLGGWAMLDLALLWLTVVATLVSFARVRGLAAWLLLPYLLWISYAGALNWAVWRANPGLL